MSMDHHSMATPLSAEDAFQVTLLVAAEITKNILKDRNPNNEKRQYWLDRLDRDIEALNRTYSGYLPDSFQNKAERFYRMVETDINYLLNHYKEKA